MSLGVISPGPDKRGQTPAAIRLYSIASSAVGDNENSKTVTLCVKRVVELDGKFANREVGEDKPDKAGTAFPENKVYRGVCSNYICDLKEGDEVLITGPVGTEMLLPQDPDANIIMLATGTGIAPMRAFIEERVAAFRAGEKVSPMALFFGARNRIEYSYEKEFNDYQEEGPLTTISLALSREQKEKIYVTHRLQQEKQLVYDLIHEQNGNLYLCGPGGNVPPQVRKAVVDAIQDCGGHSAEYAEDYVMQMQINGRYNVEAW